MEAELQVHVQFSFRTAGNSEMSYEVVFLFVKNYYVVVARCYSFFGNKRKE